MKLLFLQGIPGSGKTTWAKKFLKENSKEWIRVSRDDIRAMFGEYWMPERERLVTDIEQRSINRAIYRGYNVIVDATNLNPKNINKIINKTKAYLRISAIGEDVTEFETEYKMFDINFQDAIERDKNRERSVGENVIRKFYNRLNK